MPFMNSTTGADATALSIADLVSFDSSRTCRGERREIWGCRRHWAAKGRGLCETRRKACDWC